jgi:hypothetical protein
MTEYPYILFNKSPEQLRQLGASDPAARSFSPRASPPGPTVTAKRSARGDWGSGVSGGLAGVARTGCARGG